MVGPPGPYRAGQLCLGFSEYADPVKVRNSSNDTKL